jgi:F0F1-type ATP synthase membrane subunit b/b'
MSANLNPEVAALRDKVEEHSKELAEMRGNLHQLDKIIGATVRQSVWQLIALIVTLFVAIAGGLAYQTGMIDKRIDQIDKRFEQFDKNSSDRFEMLQQRIEQSEKNMTTRFEDLEKNMTARFEDLKQDVRARRKCLRSSCDAVAASQITSRRHRSLPTEDNPERKPDSILSA